MHATHTWMRCSIRNPACRSLTQSRPRHIYGYLWHREHESGQEEGRKERPSVIVLAVERAVNSTTLVTVLPITHSPPADPTVAIELPAPVKRHLDRDTERSWIVVSEGNEFLWPGFDLRKLPNADRYDYVFLPPRIFSQVLEAFLACNRSGRSRSTSRT